MLRNWDLNEVSDGKLYRKNDMVKIGCNDCEGCTYCCRMASDTILLDPYDVYNIVKITGMTVNELKINKIIENSVTDHIYQPHLYIDKNDGCYFLGKDGRCTIHNERPGICRLFPLGRLYKDDTFYYFHQVNECVKPGNRTKVKISKWLGIKNQNLYDDYILKMHEILVLLREILKTADLRTAHELNSRFYNLFYILPYGDDFYKVIDERINKFKNYLQKY